MIGNIEVLIPEKDVSERIAEMGQIISERYEGKELLLIGILTGGVFFLTELARNITVPVEIDFMAASSYGLNKESSGHVVITKDISRSVEGKNVIIIEDIVDSGRTLKSLSELISEKKPASLEIATLLDKPERREVEMNVDYVGFEIPNEFVLGMGLDYEQKYRNLPFIGIMK